MIEYLVIAAMLLVAASILGVLLYSYREAGGRLLDLVAFEYP